MDLKSLFAFLLDPKILATAGGYASYKYLAKDKAGFTRYAYGAGGALAGYLVGRVAQHYLAPPAPAPGLPAGAPGPGLTPEQRDFLNRQYVDLDAPVRTEPLALPAPAPAPPAPDVRAAGVNDAELLNSFGSYNPGSVDDTGDDGTNGIGGAYENGYGAEAAEEQVKQELRAKRAARARHGRN